MKPHAFRYYVYTVLGKCIFNTSSLPEAKVWCQGNRNYIIRKDFLGNYPDKKIKAI